MGTKSHISAQSSIGCSGSTAIGICRLTGKKEGKKERKRKEGRKGGRKERREKHKKNQREKVLLLFICFDNHYHTEHITSPKALCEVRNPANLFGAIYLGRAFVRS